MSDRTANVFHANLAGVTFPNDDGTSRQELISRCRVGDVVILVRDRKHQYDPNAVKVMHHVGQLGWVKTVALEEFAEFLDNGGQATARINGLTGGTPDKPTRGINIEITEWPLDETPVQSQLFATAPGAVPIAVADPQSPDEEAQIRQELANVRVLRQPLLQEIAAQEKWLSYIKREVSAYKGKLAYLQMAADCRRLAERLIGWRLGMVVIYSALLLIFSFFCEIVLGFGLPVLALAGIGIVLIGVLHYVPNDAAIAERTSLFTDKHDRLLDERDKYWRILEPLKAQDKQLAAQEADLEAKAIRANRQLQLQQIRLALLQRPWKAYRSVEFEQFLKKVFEALGGSVETTKVTGDQGADLIVTLGQCRFAIQAVIRRVKTSSRSAGLTSTIVRVETIQ